MKIKYGSAAHSTGMKAIHLKNRCITMNKKRERSKKVKKTIGEIETMMEMKMSTGILITRARRCCYISNCKA